MQKPERTLLGVAALLAAVMAWRTNATAVPPVPFRWEELAGILLCMVAARSAAMAFNRLADRRLDAGNPRTQSRHLPAGILSTGNVVIFAAVSSLVFIAGTLLFLPNRLPIYLALPVLAFLLGYSYTKRFTALAHFWLGAALMLAPICAWIALRGQAVIENPADLLPALVLAAGGAREVIDDGAAGVLIEEQTPDAIAAAVDLEAHGEPWDDEPELEA